MMERGILDNQRNRRILMGTTGAGLVLGITALTAGCSSPNQGFQPTPEQLPTPAATSSPTPTIEVQAPDTSSESQPSTEPQKSPQVSKSNQLGKHFYVIPDGAPQTCKPEYRYRVLGPNNGSRGDTIDSPSSQNVDPGMATKPTAMPSNKGFAVSGKKTVGVCVLIER